MPNLKGMNVEALMKLRNQVDERHLAVAIRARRGNCPRDHRLLAALDLILSRTSSVIVMDGQITD